VRARDKNAHLGMSLGLLDELAEALGPAAVHPCGPADTDYFGDESLHGDRVQPLCIVRPGDTGQVAVTVRIAARYAIPITARGAGTGLSGACVPSPGGIVVSFERMADVLEIDTANHIAVVQPGASLADLDAAAAEYGLVFPIRLGTDSASLGGNIATNAGGMQAVRYGVTRHHVLGIEAVTGTGAVIRSGGRYVKNSSGYDLAQLVIGSEGTLALVTEAILKLRPRLSHTATVLAPFPDVEAIATAIPDLVRSGLDPVVLEYIDRATMKGLIRHGELTLGLPEDVVASTDAYLIVVIEGRNGQRVEDDAGEIAARLTQAGASDVYGLTPRQGAQLLAARENAFWMIKVAGADDLIDMVVPRDRIPEYLRRVRQIARETGSRIYGCGHAGDGNIHFSLFETDPVQRMATLQAVYEMGLSLGGAISGEHGIGRSKKSFYQRLEDPAKLALQRAIKAAFDPAGILNPGCVFDPALPGA
jgi:glycolate oxidase